MKLAKYTTCGIGWHEWVMGEGGTYRWCKHCDLGQYDDWAVSGSWENVNYEEPNKGENLKLGIDIDGCLADFNSAFAEALVYHTGESKLPG